MRAKKIGCGKPTCFLKRLPNVGALQNHHFPLQKSDPVFQQGPPAPICVPWFPSVFFSYPNGLFWWKVYLAVGRFEWWILWGEITMFLGILDGFRICFLVGWFCWGRWWLLLFCAKIFGDWNHSRRIVWLRIEFIVKPLWKGCLNPTKKRHILGGSSQEWSLLSPKALRIGLWDPFQMTFTFVSLEETREGWPSPCHRHPWTASVWTKGISESRPRFPFHQGSSQHPGSLRSGTHVWTHWSGVVLRCWGVEVMMGRLERLDFWGPSLELAFSCCLKDEVQTVRNNDHNYSKEQ